MMIIPWSELLKHARDVRHQAYAPYSSFQVGAALYLNDGRIIVGCNVENASFGATNCAERTALFSAIAQGVDAKSMVAMAIVADVVPFITPCGICRQVMVELCPPTLPLMMAGLEGEGTVVELRTLVPLAFERDQLL